MANLIVCCDGTWNTDDQTDGNGLPIPTNVAKLYNALDRTPGNGLKSYYHPGVGTDPGRLSHFLGGTTGSGLLANVKSAYRWLATHYTPGDRMFLFGFSRGAYTARKLAGLIARSGLLDLTAVRDEAASYLVIDDLFEADRLARPFRPPQGTGFFDDPDGDGRGTTEIYFVGVWDTVGSLGVPKDLPGFKWGDWPEKGEFRDTDLSPKVRHARHALALDEKRENFLPTLWTPSHQHLEDPAFSFKQVWFPGVHSDVGGGYAECGLSDGALKWMIEEATSLGLAFDAGAVGQIAPEPLAPGHVSAIGVFARLKTAQRNVPCLDRTVLGAAPPHVHTSVLARLATPPLSYGPYWPTSLLQPGQSTTVEINARKPWSYTGLYLEAGATYEFLAVGQWRDDKIISGPDGIVLPGSASPWLRDRGGQLLQWLQRHLRRMRHWTHVQLPLTKRVLVARWFELIGTISNGVSGVSKPVPDETFVIGKARSHKVERSGYFYCFANDAWQTYFNNTGRIALTVTRVS